MQCLRETLVAHGQLGKRVQVRNVPRQVHSRNHETAHDEATLTHGHNDPHFILTMNVKFQQRGTEFQHEWEACEIVMDGVGVDMYV